MGTRGVGQWRCRAQSRGQGRGGGRGREGRGEGGGGGGDWRALGFSAYAFARSSGTPRA